MTASPETARTGPSTNIIPHARMWNTREAKGMTIHATGDPGLADAVAEAVHTTTEPLATAASVLHTERRMGAGIISHTDYTLAFTDHCRSAPVFYAQGSSPDAGPVIGPDARAVSDATGLAAFNAASVLQAATAGYVPAPNTLIEGLQQLKPGEVILHSGSDGTIRKQRSFTYLPNPETGVVDRSAALHEVVDRAIDTVIAQADGAPVWVPLSGGLDSRLILAKLADRCCPNLHSFSYGPKGNADAMVAKAVAGQLNVPWQFVATPADDVRAFFAESVRHEYWSFADGLCTTPNNQDLLPLLQLREAKLLSSDAVIVNGQTGDFISGGHIPDFLFETTLTVGELLEAIIARHHALWRSLLTVANRSILVQRIRDTLELVEPDDAFLESDRAIALWEQYEFEGRQAGYIVNGQRSYDFLGLRWALPLWDRDLVHFWRDTPPALKRRQQLYRDTWHAWDFEDVFSLPTRPVTAWSRPLAAMIVPVSIATRLVAGRTRRDRWINYARYFDRFGTHYQAFGWRHFRHHATDARNPLAYYARAWLDELGIDWPSEQPGR